MDNTSFTDGFGLSLIRLHQLMKANYLTDFSKIHELFYHSVSTEILIQLSDILNHLREHYPNKALTWKDDITPLLGKGTNQYSDITSLVYYCRNAACHIPTPKRIVTKGIGEYASFIMVIGLEKSLYTEERCKYEDDAIIVFGDTYIYVKRHIVRAYKEALLAYFSIPAFQLYKQYIKYISNT